MKTPSPHSFLPSSSSTSNETLRLVCSPSLEMFLISSPLFIEPSSFPVSHESCLSSVYFSFSSLLNIHFFVFPSFSFLPLPSFLSFPFLCRYLRRGLNINELYRMEVIVMYVIASAVDWISALWLTIIRLPHENSATRRLWRVARCRNYVASQLPNRWPHVTLDTTITTWPRSCNLARLYWKLKIEN